MQCFLRRPHESVASDFVICLKRGTFNASKTRNKGVKGRNDNNWCDHAFEPTVACGITHASTLFVMFCCSSLSF